MRTPRKSSERGVALVMVLLVVTLLVILVLEFTYSVEVETHISRNSLNALQATYLARSGINILAGALMQDTDRQVDPGLDDEWRSFSQVTPQDLLSNLESDGTIPPSWKLCGRIVDESAKVNINFTRPNPAAVQQQNQASQNQQAQNRECKPTVVNTLSYCWRDVIGELAKPFGVDESALSELDEYWLNPSPDQLAQQPVQQLMQPTPVLALNGQNGQPTPIQQQQQQALLAPEFDSLEEVAAVFPPLANRTVFDQLQTAVTALPGQSRANRKININTVTPQVLAAIVAIFMPNGNVDAADIKQKCNAETPCQPGDIGSVLGAGGGIANQIFDVKTNSGVFRLEVSAVVNGIGKTVRALVLREQGPPVPNAPSGTFSWRISYLDWEKEGGTAVKCGVADNPGSLDGTTNSGNNLS